MLGYIKLFDGGGTTFPAMETNTSVTFTWTAGSYNTGDTIWIDGVGFKYIIGSATNLRVTNSNGFSSVSPSVWASGSEFTLQFNRPEFTAGTASSITGTAVLNATRNGAEWSQSVTCTLSYNGATAITLTMTPGSTAAETGYFASYWTGDGYVDSTVSDIETIYFDFDIGEAYTLIDGEAVSANNIVTFAEPLATLAAGATTRLTVDSTFSYVDAQSITRYRCKLTPRWWKV